MKSRIKIAALAAAFFAVFQGCDSSSLATASGDRSSQGNGQVGFRLTLGSVSILRNEAQYLTYSISGPGIAYPITGSASIDTSAIVINEIPSGTRYVQVSAIDYSGTIIWHGADTVEVNPGDYTFTKIKLIRVAKPKGHLVLNLDIDSLSGYDTFPLPHSPIDTTWRDTTEYSYWVGDTGYTYSWCNSPGFVTDESLSVICNRVHVIPQTFTIDTLWFDSLVNYPVDSTPYCYPNQYGSDANTYCTRLLYRTSYDSLLCDSTYQHGPSRHVCLIGFGSINPPIDSIRDSGSVAKHTKTSRGRKKTSALIPE